MTSGRIFLFSLLLSMLCAAAFYLLVPGIAVYGPPSFDARIGGYNFDQAQGYLAHLEASGLKAAYLGLHRWIDTVFPVGILGMLVSAIWGLWARPAFAIAALGGLVATGYIVADYVENAAVAALLRTGSADITQEQVLIASSATQGKWVALFAALMLIGLGLLVTLVRGRD